MEVLHPLTSKVWEDRHAWAEEVLVIAAANEITFAGIREFKTKLRDRKLDTDDSVFLQQMIDSRLKEAGLGLDYKLGVVMLEEQ